jgi:hypothetical protein
MLAETAKLRAVRAVGLPAGLFADVAPRVLAAWRAQAMVESPSHLRAHPNPAKTLTLLAALLHARQREITDTLVDLLISTVHRINARAEKKVTERIKGGVYALIEDPDGPIRRQVARSTDDITGRMPTPDEARELGLPPGVPVFRVLRTVYDTEGRPLEVQDSLAAADRHQFRYEVEMR